MELKQSLITRYDAKALKASRMVHSTYSTFLGNQKHQQSRLIEHSPIARVNNKHIKERKRNETTA